MTYSRSRKGAWIEMLHSEQRRRRNRRSRKGAWIEIALTSKLATPVGSLPQGSVD